MIWQAEAPSNIALIKYMGQQKIGERLPINPSLSYTLDHFTSTVTLEATKGIKQDTWEALEPSSLILSPYEKTRFLNHVAFLKQQFNFTGYFRVRSRNNFEASCGLASSASSFAALTFCLVKALTALCPEHCPKNLHLSVLANWSRQGSGSSCRSFFAPWVLWQNESVGPLNLPYAKLIHRVILVDRHKKIISSSEAHRRVPSSPFFQHRAERASERLKQLLQAMYNHDWPMMYTIIRDEFLDMHRLFETAEEPFSYQKPETRGVLAYLQRYWDKQGDGPLVTMDAGPNIHLLFRPDQMEKMTPVISDLMAVAATLA